MKKPSKKDLLSGERSDILRNHLPPLQDIEIDDTSSFRFRLSLRDAVTHQLIKKFVKKMQGFAPELFIHWDPVTDRWSRLIRTLIQRKILEKIEPEKLFTDVPAFYFVYAKAKISTSLQSEAERYLKGFGASFNSDEAISKAIGELLERVLLFSDEHNIQHYSSVDALIDSKTRFLNPNLLATNARTKCKSPLPRIPEIDQTVPMAWVDGRELLSRKRIKVPAQLVYWWYPYTHAVNPVTKVREPILSESNTNGGGGGFTKEEAILSGLYELIQRDAFLVHWFSGIAPTKISVDSLPKGNLRKIAFRAEAMNFKVHFLYTTLDMPVHSCVCVLVDASGVGPAVSLGGGTHQRLETALEQSLLEALLVFQGNRHDEIRNGKLFSIQKPEKPFSIDFGREDRLWYWSQRDKKDEIDFFLSGSVKSFAEINKPFFKKKFKDTEDELIIVAKSIEDCGGKGYKVFYFEVTESLLRNIGYSVCKVIVPALLPLHLSEKHAVADWNRIETAFSQQKKTPSLESLNLSPHLFP